VRHCCGCVGEWVGFPASWAVGRWMDGLWVQRRWCGCTRWLDGEESFEGWARLLCRFFLPGQPSLQVSAMEQDLAFSVSLQESTDAVLAKIKALGGGGWQVSARPLLGRMGPGRGSRATRCVVRAEIYLFVSCGPADDVFLAPPPPTPRSPTFAPTSAPVRFLPPHSIMAARP
jgi:hypothetical protein